MPGNARPTGWVLTLLATALCGAAACASPTGKRVPGAHPIVDANGFLVGGIANGRWVSSRKMAALVRGGERYRTYSDTASQGLVTGSKPDRNLSVKLTPDARGCFAVAVALPARFFAMASTLRKSPCDLGDGLTLSIRIRLGQ